MTMTIVMIMMMVMMMIMMMVMMMGVAGFTYHLFYPPPVLPTTSR